MKYLALAENNRRILGLWIVSLIAIITFFHYYTVAGDHSIHNIFRELYYVPIFLSALLLGLRGSVLTYLVIVAVYVPYIYISWEGVLSAELNKFLHIGLQGLLAVFAGFMIDSYKKHRVQLERGSYLAGLGQASATIAHDLKNPLITIIGYANRLQQGKGNRESAAEIIMESALRMDRIARNVLDFSKPLRLSLERADIRELLNRSCNSCREKASKKEVRLSVKMPEEPVFVEMDSFHAERAFINLITNAIEASERGKTVDISIGRSKDALLVKIRDYGAGIDAAMLENIFTPFCSGKKGGTGLGMPIARKIIDEHHGRLSVESEIGAGTEVIVVLPSGQLHGTIMEKTATERHAA